MPDVDGNLVASSARLHPCVFIIIQRLSPLKTLRKSSDSMAASREHRGTEGLEHFHSHKRNDMELLPAQMDPALWCCPTD